MLYKFKGKGPAYGLGYTEGEMLELGEKDVIKAKILVNEIDAKGQPTGKMVLADKEYTADFLVQSDVITPATSEDKKKWDADKDINSIADKKAKDDEEKEKKVKEAKAKKLTE